MKLFSFKGKRTQENKKHRLPLSAYLTYLLVVSLIFTGVSFSKFATTMSASDSARVAKFSVSATGDTSVTKITLESGQTATYNFSLKNDSEVKVKYQIKIKDLPAGVTVTSSLNDVNSWKELAIGATAEGTLTFTVSEDAEGAEKLRVTISALVEQMD